MCELYGAVGLCARDDAGRGSFKAALVGHDLAWLRCFMLDGLPGAGWFLSELIHGSGPRRLLMDAHSIQAAMLSVISAGTTHCFGLAFNVTQCKVSL